MINPSFKYYDSDAWLLASISFSTADSSCNLLKILTNYDGMKHCLLNELELKSGLFKLIND